MYTSKKGLSRLGIHWNIQGMILGLVRDKLVKDYFRKFKSPSSWIFVKEYMSDW